MPFVTRYFNDLYQFPPSAKVEEFLKNFIEPKAIDEFTFIEGVKKFINIVNLNPFDESSQGRAAFYGNRYLGIHYASDLVKLWNSQHVKPELTTKGYIGDLAPQEWSYIFSEGPSCLVYRGENPAQALDQLIKGPTAIDCAMFVQLGLWFGIRYMLGNNKFNQCFGKTPFFITLLLNHDIDDVNRPLFGNPLYSFLSSPKEKTPSLIKIEYISNTPHYIYKHPGGDDSGQNCIIIQGRYYIFAPCLGKTEGMTKIDILIQLREAFNEEQTQADKDSLSFYAANSEKTHSILPFTYGNLIELAKGFAEEKISEEDFKNIEKISEFELFFDLNKLTLWLNRIHDEENFKLQQYSAQVIDHDLLPQELMDAIPLENRFSMEFSKFKVDSIAQKELLFLSQEFCHFILNQRPKLVIVSGKAGIGKTASAICAAKELSLLGKNVIFISEVMVKRWADQAKSFADLKNCAIEINKLLDKNPDVVILDDNNLVDYSGHLLLEKLYNWYVTNKNKGLFITSNEPVNFKECYGYQLDNSYLYPPFNHYNSPQYLHFKIRKDLTGESLRNQYEGQSIGAIVCESYWKENEDKLGEFELIPALDDSLELAPIRCSLAEYKSYKCETYNKLRPIQRQWLHITENNVNVKKFDSTFYKTIVIELTEKSYINKKNINITSFENLMRVLNFAHNNGGRRVILINSTSFNHEGLINQIKIQLPLAEQERMYSRLKLLLCESEKSIFEYDQFKGYIDIPTSCKASEGEIVLKPKPLYSRKRGRINQVVTLDWNLENNIKLLFSPNHLGSPKDEIQQPIEGLIEYKNLKQ